MKLSADQEKIVNTPGNLIVSASAGTGKTHTMVNKIAKEINENHNHKVAAAITFTIKAAQEIKDRLSVDVTQHFIGTNNSFAIEEVIKPFMKDVYGTEYDLDMSTDYSVKVNSFQAGIQTIKNKSILPSYSNIKKNFIFELAMDIVKKSLACRLYLQSKYFKIYIDEYQDCDNSMHEFFMYLCDNLNIETFIVGDEKQSIYMWRGAYPKAFESIFTKDNFEHLFMTQNFRSCQQIQNYSNLLCPETRFLYKPISNLDSIIWLNSTEENWSLQVLSYFDLNLKTALLRYKRDSAQNGAQQLTVKGVDFVFVPHPPIADITTNTAWLYTSIANYILVQTYSVYDLISEIPAEGNVSKDNVFIIDGMLEKIVQSKCDEKLFSESVNKLAEYLGYVTHSEHIDKLFSTISESIYQVAFELDKYQNISLTFHSSKGLEFDQVIVFAEDYKLDELDGLYNHYVASTRGKTKLIIIDTHNHKSICFKRSLEEILAKSGLQISDILTIR
ncbi:MAG: ATP-dependent helicase [Solobacterium sp.]|nr:ATP-dependent helicase [Solobacterium sp.]